MKAKQPARKSAKPAKKRYRRNPHDEEEYYVHMVEKFEERLDYPTTGIRTPDGRIMLDDGESLDLLDL